jgi:hypothetical protein
MKIRPGRPKFDVTDDVSNFEKICRRGNFDLAECRFRGNDYPVGRGNVRDGTLQAAR